MTTDNGTAGPVQHAEPSGAAEPRCAHCAALLAPAIVWCAQCYTPIAVESDPEPATPAPEVPERDDDAAEAAHPAADVATVATGGTDVESEVESGLETDVSTDTDLPGRGPLVGDAPGPQIAARADEMLALLANPATSGGPSGGGAFRSVTAVMSNTGARIAVIGAGTVLLTMVGFGLLSLLGQML